MLTAIMAISDDNIIGTVGPSGPTLPWRLPPDLKRFKELTTGHAVIMGRVTYESIGRPLPNRWNVVVSRETRASAMDQKGGLTWLPSPEMALEIARMYGASPFVIGGAQIYEALWPKIDRVELTEVHTLVGLGTVCEIDRSRWRETFRSEEQDYEGLKYHFVTLERAS